MLEIVNSEILIKKKNSNVFSLRWYMEFQLMEQHKLPSNNIIGFSDQQYYRRESINIFYFYRGSH